MSKRQRRFDRIIANTKRIEALNLPLHYFSNIHVRINNEVDFWLSTGNWHLKGQKKEGKSFAQMVNYLKGEESMSMENQHPTEEALGYRLSAALEDPKVPEEFKQEIRDWMDYMSERR